MYICLFLIVENIVITNHVLYVSVELEVIILHLIVPKPNTVKLILT